MATKKDLVEAHAFSRRRLVTAFVSGAPGGREVEPARPGRSVVGGLALAVLLLAGAAIAGVFTARPDVDWTQPGLVVSKERGAMYVILEESADPELRPVINVTSAQLILGAGTEPEIVPQEDIDEQHVGDDIGILGAPADVPTPDRLLQDGWSACTAPGRGTAVAVLPEPAVTPTTGTGYVVVDPRGEVHLVAGSRGSTAEQPRAHAYPVPDGPARDSILTALGLPNSRGAVEVADAWLRLFPAGAPLTFEAFGVVGAGQRPPDAGSWPAAARVGDWYEADGRGYVLTGSGPAPLDDFAFAAYVPLAAEQGRQRLELPEGPPLVPGGRLDLAGSRWPDRLLRAEDGELCAQLRLAPGQEPQVVLASDPEGAASAVGTTDERDDLAVTLEDGWGGYVRSAGWEVAEGGHPFLLTAKPTRHELLGPDAADRLGYGDVAPPVAPDTWVELFEPGVPLSRDAALCPPAADTPTGSSCS